MENSGSIEKLYKVKDLVSLGIGSKTSIYRWVKQGLLKKTKMGFSTRFKNSDVEAFLIKINQQKEAK